MENPHRLYRQAHFLDGAARASQFPPDVGLEVAFAGRSNAGKSSAINLLTGIGSLARISKTPGRTQQINFFGLDDSRRLVDLPGYGFARAPVKSRQAWLALIERYLQGRAALRGVALVMDVRHAFNEQDEQFLSWCEEAELPTQVLLSKSDKLGRGAASRALADARRRLGSSLFDVCLFSATKRIGAEAVRARMDEWLELP